MPSRRVKRRIFAGSVCEQYVFTTPSRTGSLQTAEPRVRFKTEDERIQHRESISRRHHARVFNANFNPQSLYTTLTLDNDHEVHTLEEGRKIGDLLVRRLKYANPDAQIMLYMGRGRSTSRIHYHMVSNGLTEEAIRGKWKAGKIVRIDKLKTNNYYNGENHGQDYTGLANYLFAHWTPEQGGKRWKQTKNIVQPEYEKPTVVTRKYTVDNPPVAPKGYKLVESKATQYGYLYFKYVVECVKNNTERTQRKQC